MNDHSHDHSVLNMMFIWLAAIFSTVTLNQIIGVCTIVYTLLQIFILIRRLWKGQP